MESAKLLHDFDEIWGRQKKKLERNDPSTT